MTTLELTNAAIAEPITKPGVYDIPNDAYQADPVKGGSLSCSGARRLLPPHCPALFRYEKDNGGRPSKRDFDFGHAAHQLVLGAGPEIVPVAADSWRTNAAKDAAKQARAEGKVPLLDDEYAVVKEMAEALRRHPFAGALFTRGKPEQSLVWVDEETGVWRRARPDWLPEGNGRVFVPDLKTCVSAAPEKIEKALWDYGYHMQAAYYLDGVKALGLARDPQFVFVFQEKTKPYLVTVAQPTDLAVEAGRFYNRQALRLFAECTATGRWPGYADDDVAHVSLPPWAQNRYFEESGS